LGERSAVDAEVWNHFNRDAMTVANTNIGWRGRGHERKLVRKEGRKRRPEDEDTACSSWPQAMPNSTPALVDAASVFARVVFHS
jgi:hypothetical protein